MLKGMWITVSYSATWTRIGTIESNVLSKFAYSVGVQVSVSNVLY